VIQESSLKRGIGLTGVTLKIDTNQYLKSVNVMAAIAVLAFEWRMTHGRPAEQLERLWPT
jgi:tRNA C32,U32 (ribose-2'-O)-methylase TrmJ